MPQLSTVPGVYINEFDRKPGDAVVPVPTAVPAFIGYTEKARADGRELANKPTRVTSLVEYERCFGTGPKSQVRFNEDGSIDSSGKDDKFYLHASVRLFFDNGGGPCHIVSVGDYTAKKSSDDLTAALEILKREIEPTLIVVPDAALLADGAESARLAQAVLEHCAIMQDRVAILDVFDGYKPRSYGNDDVISGDKGFWRLNSQFLNYGVAYYPWLRTTLLDDRDVDYTRFTQDSRLALANWLNMAAEVYFRDPADPERKRVKELIALIAASAIDEPAMPGFDLALGVARTHNALVATLPPYKALMDAIKADLNLVPPSGGIAGVYARTDAAAGVHKAPANTGINSVVVTAVNIGQAELEELHAPANGMAVNAIRYLPNYGALIWGARTLDANSADWRYVNVRRTMIFLEQTIKQAMQTYVFQQNVASTWETIKSVIVDFLRDQWERGVLMGSRPEDAFQVAVGLGTTMTSGDILEGYVRVSVSVAVSRPSEFVELTFQQQMQAS